MAHRSGRGGGPRGLGKLFQAYAARIYRYALTLIRDRSLAEEVVQETMLAIWKNARTYASGARPSTWILGIARHKALEGGGLPKGVDRRERS